MSLLFHTDDSAFAVSQRSAGSTDLVSFDAAVQWLFALALFELIPITELPASRQILVTFQAASGPTMALVASQKLLSAQAASRDEASPMQASRC